MEIIVDAYNESERAMGWYYYLQDTMTIPFKAKCIQSVSTSPLKIDEIIEIIGMNDEENCEYDMFVQVKWKDKETLGVPLKQLKGINVDDKTK
ncbi:calcium-binding protein [Neochlamydia sp. EPS4]|uniref:calcium-binding protein n=1 Tax=Neochlamydia sp. EPS4 TaxID=1478175 RepID=UPI0009B5CCF9|nr:calcium-binding protein [Neochlamydia sp. EPS4]